MLLKLDQATLVDAHIDPKCAADAADLHYVTDDQPGITRRRAGKGWVYLDRRGRRITRGEEIERIQKLAVPPGYRDVWICPDPLGHIQATGRDERGRKQYRYHQRWGDLRDRAKFAKLAKFAESLPGLRRTLRRHLRLEGLPREKVLAACVMLLDRTYMRVGNEDYARNNGSYGVTTLQDSHARFPGKAVRFEFNGKHGVEHDIELKDGPLARVIKQCRDLPGQQLLQYVDDDGEVIDLGSGDVNEYLRQYAGRDITAKDFRTWHATVLAATALRDEVPAKSRSIRRKQTLAAIDSVAQRLGNTRATCRHCYIHPLAMEMFDTGKLKKRMANPPRIAGLSTDESATLKLLRLSQRTEEK